MLVGIFAGCGGGGEGGGGGGGGAVSQVQSVPNSAVSSAQASAPLTASSDEVEQAPPPAPAPISPVPSAPNPPAQPASVPLPTTQLRYTYKMGAVSLQDGAAVLAEMETPDYAGYRPIGGLFAGPMDIRPLYQSVNAIPAYDAELLAPVRSLFDLNTVKAAGAQGFTLGVFFVSPSGIYSEMYLRPTGSTVKFEYTDIVLDPLSGNTSVAVLAQLNTLGVNGYCALHSGSGTISSLERAAGTTSRCNYEVIKPVATNLQEYIGELNAQGARGYTPFLQMPLDRGLKRIYVKDVSKNRAFGYYQLPGAPSSKDASVLARYNEEGAKGASIYDISFGNQNVTLYRIATECVGLLC